MDFISKSNYGSEGFFGELEVYLYALYIPLDILETVNEDVIMLVTLYEQLVEAQENRKIPVIVNRTFLRLFKSVLRIKGQDPQLTRKLISFISQNLN